MAIVQISQITNRMGLAIDLPQLAGAELGWSTDTRQLWIGNGTLAEGAPVVGNTEILTEFSDILNLSASYTYKGTAAGYTVQTGPTLGTPVSQSLQLWLDQWASVKDFGAMGDGLTDDTAAINRALFQLYCRQANPQIRRSLFFPAGVYIVSGTINIPSYATLYGEGPDNSIIQLVSSGSSGSYVAQTADSLQQTTVNIGSNGATPPTDITIINMAFQSLDTTKSIFLVQSATDCEFRGVTFAGEGTTSTLTVATLATAGVNFGSTTSLITSNILFDACRFTGTVWGINTIQQTQGVTITNSKFNILYQGVVLGQHSTVNGGPTGTRITTNVFDNIYAEGIIYGLVGLNVSGYNIFYNVANSFLGASNPTASIIVFDGNNNVSIGDMFQRADNFSTSYPRINLNNTQSIASTNGSQLALGTKTINSGLVTTLIDNVPNGVLISFNTSGTSTSFKIDYSMIRNTGNRTGTFWVASGQSNTVNSMDDYTENTNLGITLTVAQSGSTVEIIYSSTPTTGHNALMYYSITYFN